MADSLRPLTLLLGAVALWALCVLILALAGLGGNFSPPSVTQAAPPLPKISLSPIKPRLGPLSDYMELAQRPLTTADRKPAPMVAAGDESSTADLDVVLTSVLITPRLQLAILTDNKDATDRRVRLGEVVEGSNWRLVQLDPRQAIIEGPSGQRTLELRVFDGVGGQAPTPMSAVTNGDAVQADGARPGNAGDDQGVRQPQVLPPPPPVPADSQAVTDPSRAQPATSPLNQEQQVEAIRRRIEARRAQMRAEAEAGDANNK